jgi:tetratricopeptide (TPR) repeat protein
VAQIEQAISFCETVTSKAVHSELDEVLASAYSDKSSLTGEPGEALKTIDQSIRLYESIVRLGSRNDLLADLAGEYLKKAALACDSGFPEMAVDASDKAIGCYRQAIPMQKRPELRQSLSKLLTEAYRTRIELATGNQEFPVAIVLADEAIAYLQEIAPLQNPLELAESLIGMHMEKAGAMTAIGDRRSAVIHHDQAIALYGRVVQEHGRHDLLYDLASLVCNKALAVRGLGQGISAIALFDQAIAVFEHLAEEQGIGDVISDLTRARVFRAGIVHETGDHRAAREQASKAIEALRTEMRKTEGVVLKGTLKWATERLADLQ